MCCMKALFLSVPKWLWVSFIVFSVILVIFPQIDLFISSLFYREGLGFPFSKTWLEQLVYHSVRYLLIVIYVAALLLWIYNRLAKKTVLDFNGRKLLFVVLVLAIGSGVIVNLVLKEHWGRARPEQTINFGGKREFTPPFILSDAGGQSFSCGHASGAFALVAFAFLLHKRRTFWFALTLGYGTIVGLVRIAEGGHFLSDVIVSFYIMMIVSYLLYYLLLSRHDATV